MWNWTKTSAQGNVLCASASIQDDASAQRGGPPVILTNATILHTRKGTEQPLPSPTAKSRGDKLPNVCANAGIAQERPCSGSRAEEETRGLDVDIHP